MLSTIFDDCIQILTIAERRQKTIFRPALVVTNGPVFFCFLFIEATEVRLHNFV